MMAAVAPLQAKARQGKSSRRGVVLAPRGGLSVEGQPAEPGVARKARSTVGLVTVESTLDRSERLATC
jgi:hypothetical protein